MTKGLENDHRFIAKFKGVNYFKGGTNLKAYNHFAPDLSWKNSPATVSVIQIDQNNRNENQQLFWLKSNTQVRAVKREQIFRTWF